MEHGATIKTPQELEMIRQCGKKLARVLDRLCKMAKPGVTTEELDVAAERMIRDAGGDPAFKGYKPRQDVPPFPTTVCLSLNEEVVHAPAVPSRQIKDGDLVKIDIGMKYKGFYTDTARTVVVGKVDRKVRNLVKVTEKALKTGIKQVRAGRRVSHISKAIEKYLDESGFGIVRDLVGHGVGYRVHEPPEIPNYWQEGFPDTVLQEGMVIAIEPMVNLGTWRVNIESNGWTIVSADKSPSAHFEHTVIITKRGAEVVTK